MKEAKLKFKPGNFEIISQGDYVTCKVSGKKINLSELRYWNVELQEPYFSYVEATERFKELNKKQMYFLILFFLLFPFQLANAFELNNEITQGALIIGKELPDRSIYVNKKQIKISSIIKKLLLHLIQSIKNTLMYFQKMKITYMIIDVKYMN